MLSEDSIDKLVQPFLQRQQEINTYLIKQIAEHIRKLGELTASDIYKLERLYQTGSDAKRINAELARLTGLQIKEIKRIIKVVAEDAYLDTAPFYDYRHISFVPFDKNVQLQRMVTAIARQTVNTYRNLSKAQAFMVRDPLNPSVLRPTKFSRVYQDIVDRAVQIVASGTQDYSSAIRQSLVDIVNSGIVTGFPNGEKKVTYQAESGRVHHQRLDTAARRNILDGIRAVNQGVQDITGEQFGADGKEITVHMNPAPDHEDVQGHQFTNAEFEKMQNGDDSKDVDGRVYPGFRRAIGTLNCRHFTFSIIIGFAKPNYTQQQLNDILKKNNAGYTLQNGKHLTMYQCTQKQRELELKVRKAKDGQIAAKAAGDLQLAQKYDADVKKYMDQYYDFSRGCGLKPKPNKMYVSGYKKL